MIYEINRCPICNHDIRAEIDIIPGQALVTKIGKNEYEYSGETVVEWDNQKNIARLIDNLMVSYDVYINNDSMIRCVTCGEHTWMTKVTKF